MGDGFVLDVRVCNPSTRDQYSNADSCFRLRLGFYTVYAALNEALARHNDVPMDINLS